MGKYAFENLANLGAPEIPKLKERIDVLIGETSYSKSNFDDLLLETSQKHNIEVCLVRPSNVYGPKMRNKSIHQMINSIRNNVFAFIGPEGASANYVHVRDVVQALYLSRRSQKN